MARCLLSSTVVPPIVVIPSELYTQPTHLQQDGGQQPPAVELANGGGRRFRPIRGLQPLQLDSQHSWQHPALASADTGGNGRHSAHPSQQADPARLQVTAGFILLAAFLVFLFTYILQR
jgi:hypothetical protein